MGYRTLFVERTPHTMPSDLTVTSWAPRNRLGFSLVKARPGRPRFSDGQPTSATPIRGRSTVG